MMLPLLASLFSGLVFGLGLLLSGMTNPAKVIGFLDVAGAWDPSLAFVMVGAIAVAFFAFRFARSRGKSVLGLSVVLPRRHTVDARLILGSIVFGIGWGLAGYCPGPAIVSLGAGYEEAILFSAAMIAGMAVYELVQRIFAKPHVD